MRCGVLRRIGVVSFAGAGLIALASVLFAGSAGAIHEVVIEYTVFRGPPGSETVIATEPIEPWLQGATCTVQVAVANNSSEHPGTDLIFTSGSQTLVIEDVESEAGAVFEGEGEIIVEGESLTVSVLLGEDGVTSGGLAITFECDRQPPTTTTAPPGTEPPSPTSTAAPPPSVAPQTTVPPTTLPPSTPEPPTAGQPDFTG